MIPYSKLVRDKIPELLDAKKVKYGKRVASSDEEYKQELIKKLGEETQELIESGTVEELADVLEVMLALQQLPEFQNVEKVRVEKLATRGGFEKRIILTGEK